MYKVIVVDDEQTIIQGLIRHVDWDSLNMELAGTFSNGHDALSLINKQQIDLLITDVCMPGMNGLELIEKAKKVQPALRYIIISAHDEFSYIKIALVHGVENYLLKPINDQELIETLQKTLKNLENDRKASIVQPLDIIAFRTNILDRWVNNTIQEFELRERAELLNINITAKNYAVCIVDHIDPSSCDQRCKCAAALLEICRTVISSVYNAEYFLDSSLRAVIIICGGNSKPDKDGLNQLLDRIRANAALDGMFIFSTVDFIVDNASGVSKSYKTSVFYQNYRFLDPTPRNLFCEDYSSAHDILHDDSYGSHHLFKKAIHDENTEQALLIVQRYIQRLRGSSFQEIKSATIPFVLSLINIAFTDGQTSCQRVKSFFERIKGFHKIESIDSLNTWLAASIHDVIQLLRDRTGALHLLIRRTLNYINKNYNKDLSLKTMASDYNVSSAYLGQLFKAETGMLFNDYLAQVRLEAANTFLLETDIKICDIISRVGIPNQSYFNRLYKKAFGISPVEFRRNHHISANE